jgi:hypothetical protein
MDEPEPEKKHGEEGAAKKLPAGADRIIGGAPPTRNDPQRPPALDAPRGWWQFWKSAGR